ncbi:MAG: enolase C-terminal domain-like protein [Cyclobacteriaceae bacterium]
MTPENSRTHTVDAFESMDAFKNMKIKEDATRSKFSKATNGLPDLKITNVKAIPVRPGGSGPNLCVVKVETSEPGLYGLGCATFTQRQHAVVTVIDDYLHDFCVGKNVNNIEDMWQMAYQSAYWKDGPVQNCAISGIDMALWDIKGKRANMPVYELLGGKVRFALNTYSHSGGNSIEEAVESAQAAIEAGYRYVRIQLGGYTGVAGIEPDFKEAGFGHESDNFMDQYTKMRDVPKMFEAVRLACGDRVELLHDIHSRLQPPDAIRLCKELEQYRPFFIEDACSLENADYFEQFREQTSVPLLLGEQFTNPAEWVRPMSERWIDFVKHHFSHIGGLTPAMKVARLGEIFNVRTNWHGAGDTSPVGLAAQCHADLAIWNFGLQEMSISFNTKDILREIFPGTPRIEDGYIYVNEAPGFGVDIDEEEAAKWPIAEQFAGFGRVRMFDGTPITP